MMKIEGLSLLAGEVREYDEVGSTQEVARLLAENGAREGTIVWAKRQKRGRGRLGRSWYSPLGGLYLSIILRPSLEPDRLPLLGLLASKSLQTSLIRLTRLPIERIWPNDLFIRGRKLAGILLEASIQRSRIEYAVLGIGVNVNVEGEDLRKAVQRATSLSAESGRNWELREVLRSVVSQLDADLLEFYEAGGEGAERLAQGMRPLGEEVALMVRGQRIMGQALGLDAKGALLVRTEVGRIESYTQEEVEGLLLA